MSRMINIVFYSIMCLVMLIGFALSLMWSIYCAINFGINQECIKIALLSPMFAIAACLARDIVKMEI